MRRLARTRDKEKRGLIDYRDFCEDYASKDSKHEKRAGRGRDAKSRSKVCRVALALQPVFRWRLFSIANLGLGVRAACVYTCLEGSSISDKAGSTRGQYSDSSEDASPRGHRSRSRGKLVEAAGWGADRVGWGLAWPRMRLLPGELLWRSASEERVWVSRDR